MRLNHIFLTVALLISPLSVDLLLASEQFDGEVKRHEDGKKRNYISISSPLPPPQQPKKAVVLNKRYRKISTDKGIWEGKVATVGTTHLKLVFLQKDGHILGTRYIGSVTRKRSEVPTKFRFISSLPKSTNWSWKIIAQSV